MDDSIGPADPHEPESLSVASQQEPPEDGIMKADQHEPQSSSAASAQEPPEDGSYFNEALDDGSAAGPQGSTLSVDKDETGLQDVQWISNPDNNNKNCDPFVEGYSTSLVMDADINEIPGNMNLPAYLVCLMCFICPTASWAICYAWNLEDARARGDFVSARRHAVLAKTFMGISIAFGCLAVIVVVILLDEVFDVI